MADPFAPGGALARELPNYEHRPQQSLMAQRVAATLQKGGVALIEAGTGTGKSLAYLIPAARAALASDRPVVISTHTINLQEQLIHKDIPLVRQAEMPELKAVLVKGWSNYLCLQRYESVLASSGDLLEPDEEMQFAAIREWVVSGPEEGSRHELPFSPSSAVWEQVAAESDTCSRQACPFYDRCYLFKARREMEGAHLLIVNHHLLFADFAVRSRIGWDTDRAVLPRYDHVIIDEAHHLEDVATDHLGFRLTQGGWHQFLGRLARSARAGKAKGILPALQSRLSSEDGEEAEQALDLIADTILPNLHRVRDLGDHFFQVIGQWLTMQGVPEPFTDTPVQATIVVDASWRELVQPAADRWLDELERLADSLADLAAMLRTQSSEWIPMAQEVEAFAARGVHMLHAVAEIAAAEDPDHVFWVEGRRQRHANHEFQVALSSAPIEVGSAIRRWLDEGIQSLVCCSATLAVGGSFQYVRERIGLYETPLLVEELILPSPFAYEEQAAVFVPEDICDPTDDAFPDMLAAGLARLLTAVGGRAFVLFTSHTLLKQVKQRIEPILSDAGIPLWAHGDAPRHQLVERFASHPGSVLLGTDSFWEGVDVAGDALSLVVIVRLPFEVPSHPVAKARTQRLADAGKRPFYDYTLPRTALRLKQGFGRLIRSRTDRGAVVIYDGRVVRRGYGKALLASLPPTPVHVLPHDGLVTAVAAQLMHQYQA